MGTWCRSGLKRKVLRPNENWLLPGGYLAFMNIVSVNRLFKKFWPLNPTTLRPKLFLN
jgi:hypothetical protein